MPRHCCLGLGSAGVVGAQTQPGPYNSYNANQYTGPLYYNPGYAQYGLPGVGVSPWNPIVQAQLNLGMRTARYNMYSAWADQSNAAANLYYQQAVSQQLQNQRQMQTVQPRYDVSTRAPHPVPTQNADAKQLLSRGDVLKADGSVVWPENAPVERGARQDSKRRRIGHTCGRQGIRGRRKSFDSERCRSPESTDGLRQAGSGATGAAPIATRPGSSSSSWPASNGCSIASRENDQRMSDSMFWRGFRVYRP